jgi:hypothetical protein
VPWSPDYVRQEFNRADALGNNGRKGTVGFALTTLQRRLASSPEAIYQSLKRRRERLERRLQAARQAKSESSISLELLRYLPQLSNEDLDELDEAPDKEQMVIAGKPLAVLICPRSSPARCHH